MVCTVRGVRRVPSRCVRGCLRSKRQPAAADMHAQGAYLHGGYLGRPCRNSQHLRRGISSHTPCKYCMLLRSVATHDSCQSGAPFYIMVYYEFDPVKRKFGRSPGDHTCPAWCSVALPCLRHAIVITDTGIMAPGRHAVADVLCWAQRRAAWRRMRLCMQLRSVACLNPVDVSDINVADPRGPSAVPAALGRKDRQQVKR